MNKILILEENIGLGTVFCQAIEGHLRMEFRHANLRHKYERSMSFSMKGRESEDIQVHHIRQELDEFKSDMLKEYGNSITPRVDHLIGFSSDPSVKGVVK